MKKYLNNLGSKILGLALLLASLESCVKDNFDFEKLAQTTYEPTLAIPLAYSSLTIQDLLDATNSDSFLVVNSDNSITLMYASRLISLKATDVVNIPDQTASSGISMNNTDTVTLYGVGSVTINGGDTIDFNTNGTASIDSLFIKSGQLSFNINSTYMHSGNLKVTIPAATKNGVPLSFTSPITYSGNLPVTVNKTVDLSSYKFDMTLGGTTQNKFGINYEITIINSGNPINPGDNISFNTNISSVKFDKLFGYIGQIALSPGLDTVDISLFAGASGLGVLTIVDPKVHISLTNSYGLPIQASFKKLDGYNKSTGSYPIGGSGVPNPLPIYSPSITEIGQSKTGKFTLDKANSNIVSVINNVPTNIIYQIESQANPGGFTTQNFLTDSSEFYVDLDVELPLYGTAKNFEIIDTTELSFGEVEELESINLRAYFENGLPVDVGIQIYLTDSLYNHLDTLVNPYTLIMPGANVSSTTGKVTSPAIKTNDFTFDKARLNKVAKMRKAIIKASLSTSNGGTQDVKFYTDYKLDVKLGIAGKVKMKF